MPRSIRIEGLKIESKNVKSIRYFDDPLGKKSNPPFPYRTTEKIEVSGLKTPNQLIPGISRNPALAESVKLIENP